MLPRDDERCAEAAREGRAVSRAANARLRRGVASPWIMQHPQVGGRVWGCTRRRDKVSNQTAKCFLIDLILIAPRRALAAIKTLQRTPRKGASACIPSAAQVHEALRPSLLILPPLPLLLRLTRPRAPIVLIYLYPRRILASAHLVSSADLFQVHRCALPLLPLIPVLARARHKYTRSQRRCRHIITHY